MAIKHVKKYYQQVEKMYVELLSDLEEMKDDFKEGKVTEEEFNNLMLPVNSIRDNYKRLSYMLYLLFLPQRDSKRAKFDKQNQMLVNYFQDNNLTMEQEKELNKDALKEFKRLIKERKLDE